MTKEQIMHMVNRFLGWRLPENFNPDGGISFKPTFNDHLPTPMRHEPTGTNLLDVTQAEAMVRHMLDGLPEATPTVAVSELRRFQRHVLLRTFDEKGQIQPDFLAASEHLDTVLAAYTLRSATADAPKDSR